MRLATVVILALVSAPATAGETWSTEDAEAIRKTDDYDKAMSDGDDAALAAASGATNAARTLKLVNAAARAYERAAKARPDLAEPHWRAASVLYGFLVDCDYGDTPLCLPGVDVKLYRRILKHWHAFEEADPLDPRNTDMLFERALLYTKLETPDDLRGAIADYYELISRSSGDASLLISNMAEVYMLLGDLDEAIYWYEEAIRSNPHVDLYYGLAVALDRDAQGTHAREIFADMGTNGYLSWLKRIQEGRVFYVPDGEIYYYEALARESLGETAEAIAAWQAFIDSGANAQYQPIAKKHLNRLTAKTTRE